jgi:predicted kinase
MKNTKPIFYMVVGLPASGKSTWAETHKDELNAVVHSSDDLRAELFGDANDQSKNTEVFEILHKRIKDDLRAGKNVIYDATNLVRKRRIAFLNELKNISCEKVCVLFATPFELCCERNFARERQVPEGAMARMYKQFETPWYSEGWDDIQIVWADYKGLSGFEFDIMEDLKRYKNLSHDNPHHRLSISDHMIAAYNHYIYNYDEIDDHLRWACLMHDIGKYDVKAFVNSKGEPCNIAHYYSHNNVSSYKALFYLRELCSNWTDKDILYTSLLIDLHMRPHLSWKQSEKAKEKDRRLFGDDIVRDIEILHECDLAAH